MNGPLVSQGPVLVQGLGEAASAVAHALWQADYDVALQADAAPLAHRHKMAFADAWWDGMAILDGLTCVETEPRDLMAAFGTRAALPFLRLPLDQAMQLAPWKALVDARLNKRREPMPILGLAPLSVGIGPGFVATANCDLAIETQWGNDLGRVIRQGPTNPLGGDPRSIDGVGRERLIYAPVAGLITVLADIGRPVVTGEVIARIGMTELVAPITGTLRGMVRDGMVVTPGDKLAEVDPRGPGSAQIMGIGKRPEMIAKGVLAALSRPDRFQT